MKVEAKLMGNGEQRLTIVIVGAGLWELEYAEYKKARERGFDALINTTVEPPIEAEHLLSEGVFVLERDISAVQYCEQFIPYRFEKVRPKMFHEGLPGWLGQWIALQKTTPALTPESL